MLIVIIIIIIINIIIIIKYISFKCNKSTIAYCTLQFKKKVIVDIK